MTMQRHDMLTAEQVEVGRRMREEHGLSWYRIGQTLGCEGKTIRRALDPLFDEHMRVARAKRRKSLNEKRGIDVQAKCVAFKPKQSRKRAKRNKPDYEGTTEERSARRHATRQDIAFIDAMTKAVRAEREACPIGVDTRPGTHSPRLVESRASGLRTIFGSSSQMCADSA